jgi:integrase
MRINGKQIVKSLKTKKEKQALKNAADFRRENQNIINAQTKEELAVQIQKARTETNSTKGISIGNGYNNFHESPSRKQNTADGTLKNYERIFNLFLSWLKPNYPGITIINKIDKKISQEYAKYLWNTYKTYKGQRMSENTYNYHIGALQTIFDIVAENKNIWKSIERKEENKKKHKLLSKEEILNILKVFEDDKFYLRYKEEMEVLIYLGIYTGLRLIDCVHMRWENINGIIKTVPVKTKGFKKTVSIPLSSQLDIKIKSINNKAVSQYLLPKIQERYSRNPDGIKNDIKKIFIKVGIKPDLEGRQNKHLKYNELEEEITGFHCFRHTFINECVKNSMDIVRLSTITGDSIKTLQKYYIHLKDEVIKKEAERLPNFK